MEARSYLLSNRAIDQRLRLPYESVEVRLVLEALRVDLVDVLGARRPRREPSAGGHDLQTADGRAVAGGLREFRGDSIAAERLLFDVVGRQPLQSDLLLSRGGRVDARVGERAELGRELTIVLTGI